VKNAAVLAGINTYRNYPEDTLKGCVQDAQNLRTWLFNFLGFKDSAINLLLDSRETAAGEKAAVAAMIAAAGPGDRLVWSHSSHGTNNPDSTQRDGLQEILCCYDLREKGGDWDEDTGILARWIGQAVTKLHPKATLDIIIDACHAPEGSQLKALGRSYSRARFLPRSMVGVPVKPKTLAGMDRAYRLPANVALWSACQPEQTSADAYIDGHFQGAFTAAFLKSCKPGRTRADMIATARKWLKDNRYAQTPHLYCGQALALSPMGA
jgi:metacaspase-1